MLLCSQFKNFEHTRPDPPPQSAVAKRRTGAKASVFTVASPGGSARHALVELSIKIRIRCREFNRAGD